MKGCIQNMSMQKKQRIDKHSYIPKVGDIVEIWERESPRHKYNLWNSFCQILRIEERDNNESDYYKSHYEVSIKTSESFIKTPRGTGWNGCSSLHTNGYGKWDTKFVKIGSAPVKTDGFEYKGG